jgi:hypothetical protein
MKKILIGLIIGLVLGVAAFFMAMSGIKQTAYDSGYSVGNKAGITSGTTIGIAQGVAQVKAMEQQHADSLAAAEKSKMAVQKSMHKHVKVVKETQNWHVIDGKIADPIAD